MSLRSASILQCRTWVMTLFAACQMTLGVQGIAFAQPLAAEPLPPELQAALDKARQEADKKRLETFKRIMDAAIKKETDLGMKQRLERERDATIREWSPPAPAAPVPVPPPRPADAALLADLKRILGTKQISVTGGDVTLVYDFTLRDVQRVAQNDFDLPRGVLFGRGGIQIPAKDEVKLRATFRRLKRVKATLFHENWAGEWVEVGDAFKSWATRGTNGAARITGARADQYTVFALLKDHEPPMFRTLDLLFAGKKTEMTFDTWGPGGGPQPVLLASDFVMPQNPGPLRLMGGSGGAVYSTLTVEGELDPAWVQAELARPRR